MTKLELLKMVSQEEIIKKFLPDFNPTSTKNYKSPFSDKDDKPSLSFFRSGNDWKFKSHNTGHHGDVFQFVADIKGLDCKTEMQAVIDVIAKEFSLNGFAATADKKKNIKISFEKAPSVEMLKYFEQFKIDLETLIRFDVKQVKYHEFVSSNNKLCKFDYRKLKQLAICYTVNERIKIYFPHIHGVQQKQFGFKNQTAADIFGKEVIAKTSTSPISRLFIAAGEKDCLALNANGFPAVSFQSENTLPTVEQVKFLQLITQNIFIVYDNDDAGKNASTKICNKYNFKSLSLPKDIKDVADFFSKNSKEDFEKIITENSANIPPSAPTSQLSVSSEEEPAWTIFHSAEKYLSKNYDLRFNEIKLEIEARPKNSNNDFASLNENSLFVEMNKAGIKIGMDKLIAILKSDYVKAFNPFIDYFKNLPAWDGVTDHISKLCSYVQAVDDENFSLQFTKWMMRAVKCATVKGYYNKQAFILIHNKQNSGKTSFCRFICPPALTEYFAENLSDDKDSRIAIAKNFLINLDELSSLAKHEINSLKALFSKDIINERLPYDRKTTIIHRVASFLGSTNMVEFLTDETGSVRWLCFEIKSIDWRYSKNININQCWAQAVGMIKEGLPCEMDREEIEANESRNKKFQQLSTEAEIIPKFFNPAEENDQGSVFFTATEILLYISSMAPGVKLNKIMVGRAMPLCGFKRIKDSKNDRYGYWVTKAQQ